MYHPRGPLWIYVNVYTNTHIYTHMYIYTFWRLTLTMDSVDLPVGEAALPWCLRL